MVKIKVADLKPNPFRKLDAYPLRQEKVEALKESIKSTAFWDNLVVRKSPGSGYELAFGHHRWQALKEMGITEIDVPVRDLDDDTMLRMMAHENRQEWGAAAAFEQETIRAVVEAYGAGTINLPRPKRDTPKSALRVAPHFAQIGKGRSLEPNERTYTAETLQDYLGFKEQQGLVRIKDTLNALALIEQGVLRKEDVGELTVYKVKLVHQVAKEYEHNPEVQKKVARGVAKKLRDDEIIGLDKERATRARLEASRIAHAHSVQSKSEMTAAERGEKARTQDDEAIKLSTDLDNMLRRGQVLKRIDALSGFTQFCSAGARKELTTSLKRVRDHFDKLINKIEAANSGHE